MAFDKVSTEVVVEIFKYIPLNRDLANVSLCSRRFHELAEPILYSSFTQTGENAIPAYLRTVSKKPHLTRLVKRFTASPWDPLDLSFIEGDEQMVSWVRSFMPASVHGELFCEDWFRVLVSGVNWDPAVALLLLLFSSSLEQLDMQSYGYGTNCTYINAVLANISLEQLKPNAVGSLLTLTRVSLEYGDTEGGMRLNYLAPFLKMKSVTDFRGHMISGEGQTQLAIFYTTNVKLNYSNFDAEAMRTFFRGFHSLKNFEFVDGGSNVGYDDLCPPAARDGLLNSKDSLERLVLTRYEDIPGDDMGDPLALQPFGSMVEFKKLR